MQLACNYIVQMSGQLQSLIKTWLLTADVQNSVSHLSPLWHNSITGKFVIIYHLSICQNQSPSSAFRHQMRIIGPQKVF